MKPSNCNAFIFETQVDAGGTIRLRTRNQTKPDELSQEILDILKLVAEEHWPEVHFGDTLRISRLAGSLTNQVLIWITNLTQ